MKKLLSFFLIYLMFTVPVYPFELKSTIKNDLLKEIENQKHLLKEIGNCTDVTLSFLKYLGFESFKEDGTIYVTGYSVIEDVSFEGLPDIFSKKSVDSIRLFLTNQIFSESIIKSAKHILEFKLKSMGYREAKVEIEVLSSRKGYSIRFKVEKGPLYVLRKLMVSCSKEDVCKLIEEKVSLRENERIDAGRLKKELDSIRDQFIQNGFYNMDIRFEFIEVNEENEQAGVLFKKLKLTNVKPVDLLIKVKEGRKYVVKFEGKEEIKEDHLRKLLTFQASKAFDEFEVENSRKNIENFLKNSGYPYAKVQVKISEDRSGTVEVIFKLSKGKLVLIKQVEANFKFTKEEKKTLKKLIGLPFSKEKIEKLLTKIKLRFRKKGYQDVKVNYRIDNDKLYINLEKGKRYILKKVFFINDKLTCSKNIHIPNVYSKESIQSIKNQIISCYKNKGFIDAKVNFEEKWRTQKESSVEIYGIFRVNPGKKCMFGYVVVSGLRRTKTSRIENLLILKPLSVYSEKLVMKQYSILSNSRLFSSVSINEFRSKNIINVLIRVQEGPKLHTKGFVGYGTDSGYVLNGIVSSYSPFGFGLKYSFFGNHRRKQGYDAVFRISKPGFLSFRNEVSYSIVKKEQIYESFKADRTLYKFNLKRESSENIYENVGFEVSREKVRDTSIEEKEHFLKREIYADLTYDMRDNRSNPKNGYTLYIKGAYAGRLLGGNTDYYLVESKVSFVKSFLSRFSLATRLGFGAIEPFTNKKIPLQDRFFLGGAESVRGYKFGTISPKDEKGNYVGGNCYGLFNFELRALVRKKFQVAAFYDAGEVFSKASKFNFNLSDWHSSVGVGLRYLTPVGPLRIDYGYKLKTIPGQGRGRVHISFGFPF